MLWDQQLTIRTRKVIFKFPVCWFWEVFHLSSSIFSRWAQEPALAEISEVGWMKNHQLIRWNWWSHTLIFCLQVGFKLFSYLGFLLQVYDNSISLLLQLIFFLSWKDATSRLPRLPRNWHEHLDAKISTKHSGCLSEASNFRHPFLAKRSNMGHGWWLHFMKPWVMSACPGLEVTFFLVELGED